MGRFSWLDTALARGLAFDGNCGSAPRHGAQSHELACPLGGPNSPLLHPFVVYDSNTWVRSTLAHYDDVHRISSNPTQRRQGQGRDSNRHFHLGHRHHGPQSVQVKVLLGLRQRASSPRARKTLSLVSQRCHVAFKPSLQEGSEGRFVLAELQSGERRRGRYEWRVLSVDSCRSAPGPAYGTEEEGSLGGKRCFYHRLLRARSASAGGRAYQAVLLLPVLGGRRAQALAYKTRQILVLERTCFLEVRLIELVAD